MKDKAAQTGQVGLVILLVMVVVSTIGLSVASRSTQEVTISRQTQEAAKTFAAAESAIERVLSESADTSFIFDGSSQEMTFNDIAADTTVDVSIAKELKLDTVLKEGVTAEVDVTGAINGDTLRIEWAKSRNCADNPSSLMVEIVNDNGTTSTTRYQTVAPCDHGDNFTLIDTNNLAYQGTTEALRYDLALTANDTKVRLVPVYADTTLVVAATGGWQLPPQQFKITSVGQNEAEGGRETKAVEVDRTQPYAPGILDYSLVSGTTITK